MRICRAGASRRALVVRDRMTGKRFVCADRGFSVVRRLRHRQPTAAGVDRLDMVHAVAWCLTIEAVDVW